MDIFLIIERTKIEKQCKELIVLSRVKRKCLDMLILRRWDIQQTNWKCKSKTRTRDGVLGAPVHSWLQNLRHREYKVATWNCAAPGAHYKYLSYNY